GQLAGPICGHVRSLWLCQIASTKEQLPLVTARIAACEDVAPTPLSLHRELPMPNPSKRPIWHEGLAAYAQPRLGRSLFDIATSVVPYLALSGVMYVSLGVSPLLVLLLAVLQAGFLVRTFVVFHDCAHGS